MTHAVNPKVAARAAGLEEDFGRFLARLSPKLRVAVDKHVGVCERATEPGYAKLWKRWAEFLGRLAPHAVEAAGTAVRFYILDGKYRRQVFALEDAGEGWIRVVMPDIVEGAVARGILGAGEGGSHALLRAGGARLEFEGFCADTKDIPDYCMPMLGWGRRAVRTGMAVTADERVLRGVERLCELAAEAWAPAGGVSPGAAFLLTVRS